MMQVYSSRILSVAAFFLLFLVENDSAAYLDISTSSFVDDLAPQEEREGGFELEGPNLIIAMPTHPGVSGDVNTGALFLLSSVDGFETYSETIMYPPDVDSQENLYFGAAIDIEFPYLVAGAYGDLDGCVGSFCYSAGAVYVFVESTLGSADWETNSYYKLLADGGDPWSGFGDRLGSQVRLAGEIIIAGARTLASTRGSIVAFWETAEGARDWQDNQYRLRPALWQSYYQHAGFGVEPVSGGRPLDVHEQDDGVFCIVGGASKSEGDLGVFGAGTVHYWCESGPGLRDFPGREHNMTEPSATAQQQNWFGINVLFHRNLLIVGQWVGGLAHVYTESAPNARDWDTTTPVQLSSDDTNLASQWLDAHEDMIVINWNWGMNQDVRFYTESVPGAGDWSEQYLLVSDEVTYLNGYYGRRLQFSPDGRLLIGYKRGHRVFMLTECDTEPRIIPCDCSGLDMTGAFCQLQCHNNGIAVVSGSFGELDVYEICNCTGTNATGLYCETSCQNGGTDLASSNFTKCDCTGTNAKGILCEDPCLNNGTDHSDPDIAENRCDCTGTNAIGVTCQTPCLNGGTDHTDPLLTVTQCDCTGTNALGATCDKTCNDGVADLEAQSCDCTGSGSFGKFCNKDINDCESCPCQNGGTCTDDGNTLWPNRPHEYNCTCPLGYAGVDCEQRPCDSSPCLYGGVCSMVENENGEELQCNCSLALGFTGLFCESDIDECASSPCLNGGICIDLLGSFVCIDCNPGYTGDICADDIDECLSSPCQNSGVCDDKGERLFECTCDEFWEGSACSEDVDDCILKGYYCENGAACSDDPVNMGDVLCDCSTSTGGFTGKYCNVPIEDACVTYNPCANGGKCILDDITKAMSCDCADTGYEGDVCDVQVYVSECVSSPCLNEGQCYDPSDQQDNWYCVCVNGYSGEICDFRACDSMPCQNGGTCTNSLEGGYTCACVDTYGGTQCQVKDNQVGAGPVPSSSTGMASSNGVNNPNKDDSADNNSNGNESMIMVIVIAVITVAIIACMAYYFTNKARSDKFVMPT